MKILICFLAVFFISQSLLAEQIPLTEEIRGLAEEANPVLPEEVNPILSEEANPVLPEENNSNLLEESVNPSIQENVEKIKITGSRIKRIDMEGPSPVTIFNKEDLENSGYNSVADFLRDTTISAKGVPRERAGSSTSGEAFISIKGEEALILINGLRVAEDPDANLVDLNLIPMNAIERIEVLKDGGSALYGSDAIGGVINFITRKNFSGVELHGNLSPTLYPLYRGKFKKDLDDYFAGSQASAGVVFGDSKKNWSYIGTLKAHYKENITSNQRQWGTGVFSNTSPEVVYVSVDDEFIDTTCPTERQTKKKKGCQFDYTPYADFTPTYFQMNAFMQGQYNTGERQFYSQFLASYKINQYYYAPLPVAHTGKSALIIPSNHKMSSAQGKEVKIGHRFMETGRRDTSTNHWFVDLTTGVKGYLSKTWDYDFNIKGAHIIKNQTEKNTLLRDKVISAITEGKYDPAKPTKEGLSSAIYTAENKNSSSLLASSLDFSGESAWGLNLATGFQAYFQNYTNKVDPQQIKKNILSGVGADGKGNRYVGSYYIEAIKNFHESLELQLAWRADYYSDFGFTSFGLRELFDITSNNLQFLDYLIGTPKVAFRFQPQTNLLFRGSVGASFRAPDLSSLYGNSSTGFPWAIDTVGCIAKLNTLNKDFLKKKQENDIKKIKESQNLSEEDKKAKIKSINEKSPILVENLGKIKGKTELVKNIVIYGEESTSHEKVSKENKKLIKDQNLVSAVTSLYGSTDDSCTPAQYVRTTTSNKDLKETRALVASVGSVLEISPDLNINVDFSYIEKTGIPGAGADSDGLIKRVFDTEALHGSEHLKDKFGFVVERDNENLLKNITAKPINLKKSRKLYMDLGLKSNLNFIQIQTGKAYYKNDFTLFFINRSEDFPGFGLQNIIGDFGNPRWLNMATLGWQNKKHHIFLKAFSVAPFKRISNPALYFPLNTRFDINYEYIMSEKTKLNFNMYNFLNLGLNFHNKKENLVSLSLDSPFDINARSLENRIASDIHNIHGAYFTVKVSHLL